MTSLRAPQPFDQLLDIDRRCRGRVLAAEADTAAATGVVGGLAVRLAARNLLLPLDEVSEIVPIPRITRVPGVKSWLMGITNLRGNVISVVDLRDFLSGERATETPRSRVVVVNAADWGCGLLIDEVIGMRHFTEDAEVGIEGQDAGIRPYLSRAFRGDGAEWLSFSTQRLLGDPRFLGAAN